MLCHEGAHIHTHIEYPTWCWQKKKNAQKDSDSNQEFFSSRRINCNAMNYIVFTWSLNLKCDDFVKYFTNTMSSHPSTIHYSDKMIHFVITWATTLLIAVSSFFFSFHFLSDVRIYIVYTFPPISKIFLIY